MYKIITKFQSKYLSLWVLLWSLLHRQLSLLSQLHCLQKSFHLSISAEQLLKLIFTEPTLNVSGFQALRKGEINEYLWANHHILAAQVLKMQDEMQKGQLKEIAPKANYSVHVHVWSQSSWSWFSWGRKTRVLGKKLQSQIEID